MGIINTIVDALGFGEARLPKSQKDELSALNPAQREMINQATQLINSGGDVVWQKEEAHSTTSPRGHVSYITSVDGREVSITNGRGPFHSEFSIRLSDSSGQELLSLPSSKIAERLFKEIVRSRATLEAAMPSGFRGSQEGGTSNMAHDLRGWNTVLTTESKSEDRFTTTGIFVSAEFIPAKSATCLRLEKIKDLYAMGNVTGIFKGLEGSEVSVGLDFVAMRSPPELVEVKVMWAKLSS